MKYLHRDKIRKFYSEYANSQTESKELHHEVIFIGNRDNMIIIDVPEIIFKPEDHQDQTNSNLPYMFDVDSDDSDDSDREEATYEPRPKRLNMSDTDYLRKLRKYRGIIDNISSYLPHREIQIQKTDKQIRDFYNFL